MYSLIAGRTPERQQSKWLAALVELRGKKRTSVALANKNARIGHFKVNLLYSTSLK